MTNPQISLPDFANPPLVEVVLSVQFDELTKLGIPQIGLLWSEYKDRFPTTEEHPPIEPVIETFAHQPIQSVQVKIELLDRPPIPRVWFLNESGGELIQVQRDRFIHNWRKVNDADCYPRYEHIRHTFQTELEGFCGFLRREQIGEIAPNQCEITYINHIPSGSGWSEHGQIGEVFTVWENRYSEIFLPEPQDVNFAVRYIIPDSKNEPLGRLHINTQSLFKMSRNRRIPLYVVTLTARGRPDGVGIEGVLKFLDKGREWIVQGFASITSKQMHEVWRRNYER